MSIKTRLIAMVTAIALIPAIVVGAVAYRLSRSALEERIRSGFQDRARLLNHQLSSLLTEVDHNTDAWVVSPAMADIKIGDSDLRISKFLLATKKSYPIIKDMTVVDAKGVAVASSNPAVAFASDEGAAKAALMKFEVPRLLAKEAIVKISPATGASFLGHPILDLVAKDGSVAGAMIVELDAKVLAGIVAAANDGKAEADRVNFYLWNSDGEIASLVDAVFPMEFAAAKSTTGLALDRGLSSDDYQSQKFVSQSFQVHLPLNGLASPLGLTLVQSEAMTFKAVADLRRLVSFITLGLAAVFVAIGSVFARSFARPIIDLQQLAVEIVKSRDLSKRISVTSRDEIGALGNSFNHLLAEIESSQKQLEQYSQGLEVKVKERTEAIRTIMDHVTIGLFITDHNLRLREGYSAACGRLFEVPIADAVLTDKKLTELLRLPPRSAEHFEVLYQQIFEESLLADLAVSQLPDRFELEGRHLELVGSLINGDDGKTTGVLFCLADITSLVKAERENARNQSLIMMISNRDGFRGFIQDSASRLKDVLAKINAGAGADQLVKRNLHTVKGNSGIYGLSQVSQLIHHVEDKAAPTMEDVRQIERLFVDFLDENFTLLGVRFGESMEDSYVIPASLVRGYGEEIATAKELGPLRQLVEGFMYRLQMKQVATILGPVESAFTLLAARMGKQVKVTFQGRDTLIPDDLVPVFRNLTHVLRNAIDHGLEPPSERGTKDPLGRLNLAVRSDAGTWTVVIEDDGRGIDTTRLVAKAVERGVVKASDVAAMADDAKLALVFADGISTVEKATDISGRGVGMSAVLAAVKASGGSIKIDSRKGLGTKFTLTLRSRGALAVPTSQRIAA